MGVLDESSYRRKGRDSFGGEFGAFHFNQWGIDALLCGSVAFNHAVVGGGE